MTASRTIESRGELAGIGVEIYWDVGATDIVTRINWATFKPGASQAKSVYVKNTGNVPVTLKMTCSDWTPPEAADHLDMSWNKEGENLLPDEVVGAVLVLAVSEAISGITDFSFDITIEGTG